MRELKRTILRVLFVLEIITFSWFYFFGSQGILTIMAITTQVHTIDTEIGILKRDILDLEHQIVLQNECPFYKEKIAREQLQMARTDEEIYIYS